jgi:hypothetical protein
VSTLTAQWVSVPDLYVCAQITYPAKGRDYIVLEVLEQDIGGWVVIAHAVDDMARPPKRRALVYGSPVAQALVSHRVLVVDHA